MESSRCRPLLHTRKRLLDEFSLKFKIIYRICSKAFFSPYKHGKWKHWQEINWNDDDGTKERLRRIRYWKCKGLQQQTVCFICCRFECSKLFNVWFTTEGAMSSHYMWSPILSQLHRSTDKWRVNMGIILCYYGCTKNHNNYITEQTMSTSACTI